MVSRRRGRCKLTWGSVGEKGRCRPKRGSVGEVGRCRSTWGSIGEGVGVDQRGGQLEKEKV